MSEDKKGFSHFMLKEIYDQPRSAMDAVASYLSPESQQKALEDVRLNERQIQLLRRINIVASGASRHAGMVGEFMIERMARIPSEVDFASQYCYRDPLTEPDELTLLLSQSGTTADTLAAQREAKLKGARTIAICNVKGSPITQESDGNVYTHCGEEVSIAATKSFTAQLIALFAFAIHLASVRRSITAAETRVQLDSLMGLPEKVQQVLKVDEQTKILAKEFSDSSSFMFLGRDISYPIALEGALKLKETSYIHAEGFPTGEMKHGPNALVDENLPVVMILTRDEKDPDSMLRHEKSMTLLKEIASRGTRIIALTNSQESEVGKLARHVIPVPSAPAFLLPVLEIIPLQLLAYHIAVLRGVDVDRPRNLSKSVVTD